MHAILLAGGRSTRMGQPKALLLREETPLVAHLARLLLDQLDGTVAVVGEAALDDVLPVDGRCVRVQEDPPFSGPVMGIAAGLAALQGDDDVVLLAVDLVHADAVVESLLATAIPTEMAGVSLPSERGPQWLASRLRTPLLRSTLAAAGHLENASVRRVLGCLPVHVLAVDPGIAADVDSPEQLPGTGVRLA